MFNTPFTHFFRAYDQGIIIRVRPAQFPLNYLLYHLFLILDTGKDYNGLIKDIFLNTNYDIDANKLAE